MSLLGRRSSCRQGARGQNRGPRVKGRRPGEGGWREDTGRTEGGRAGPPCYGRPSRPMSPCP
ncbi:hypothetical protein BC826DRAFT_999030 [Russula brevipes]|nr:hypothetical protein BC826DRAFT_999030 [Russula brevipes]